MLEFKNLVFVGIDPHKAEHMAIMVDHWGEVFFELTFPNQANGFEMLLDNVKAHIPEGKTVVFGHRGHWWLGALLRPVAHH